MLAYYIIKNNIIHKCTTILHRQSHSTSDIIAASSISVKFSMFNWEFLAALVLTSNGVVFSLIQFVLHHSSPGQGLLAVGNLKTGEMVGISTTRIDLLTLLHDSKLLRDPVLYILLPNFVLAKALKKNFKLYDKRAKSPNGSKILAVMHKADLSKPVTY